MPRLAAAHHVTCTWTGPGPDRPDNYGFTKFCISPQTHNGSTNAVFLCNGGVKVADWNFLRASVLEFRSPCAKNGYASDTICEHSDYWATCIQDDQGYSYCRFIQKLDDCEWETLFTFQNLPATVSVYYT